MKIAIVGTSPTWEKAPFDNNEWRIWSLAGSFLHCPHADKVYELHGNKIVDDVYLPQSGFVEKANGIGKGLVLRDEHPSFPDASVFNKDPYVHRYGKFPFTSSVAWVLAEAIAHDPEEIGLFGVNMAADTEYGKQKPGCFFFIGVCAAKGIDVTVPEESTLLHSPGLYGYDKKPDMSLLDAKKQEMLKKITAIEEQNRQREIEYARNDAYNRGLADGSIQTIDWIKNNNIVR